MKKKQSGFYLKISSAIKSNSCFLLCSRAEWQNQHNNASKYLKFFFLMHIPLFLAIVLLFFSKGTFLVQTDVMAIFTLKNRSIYGSQLQRLEIKKLLRMKHKEKCTCLHKYRGRKSRAKVKRIFFIGKRGHSSCQSL